MLQPTPDETSENTYHLPDDVDDDKDDDQGPDLDSLLDRQLTLTPDSHLPTAESIGDLPPALPPKMSRRQNGVVPHTSEDSAAADSNGLPPEIPPRREKKDTSDSTVRIYFSIYIIKNSKTSLL